MPRLELYCRLAKVTAQAKTNDVEENIEITIISAALLLLSFHVATKAIIICASPNRNSAADRHTGR